MTSKQITFNQNIPPRLPETHSHLIMQNVVHLTSKVPSDLTVPTLLKSLISLVRLNVCLNFEAL